MANVVPFKIDLPDSMLNDLQRRLANARWPDAEVVDGWTQGIPLHVMRSLTEYWTNGYQWRAREQQLNRFDQFTTPIDITTAAGTEAIDIHFIHQRSPHADATPLLITHGWPGSVVEFTNIIDALTDPTAHGGDAADAFHVIAPSLPGFAFSGKPTIPGIGVEQIAQIWTTLMERLGYDRYLAQGGDWGSAVTQQIGGRDGEHCAGIHITLAMSSSPQGEPNEPEELAAIERFMRYQKYESGYAAQQRTRPQTLGYGLADSPIGQLAWIAEKFRGWSDMSSSEDHPFVIDRDLLLDNVMLYWATNSATSSARLYWESFGEVEVITVDVPTGVTVYPNEIVPPVRKWMEPIFTDICFWSIAERGGHFAAIEVPESFVCELRAWHNSRTWNL